MAYSSSIPSALPVERVELPWGAWFRDFGVSKSFLLLLPLSFGWSGVAMFFVVSGFCIHLSFEQKPNWLDFFVRRLFRIYPPYLFAVLLFAFCIPWSRVGYSLIGAMQVGSHLALIHNFHRLSFFGINAAFWSIAVEAQLYLLYPLLLVLVSRLGWRRSLIYIAALEIGLRGISSLALIATGQYPPLWFDGLPFLYWFSWSIGAAVADAYLSGRRIPFANHSLMAWSGIAIGSSFVKPFASFSFLFFALLTATAIAKLLHRDRVLLRLPVFLSTPLRVVGVWSFSIYLLHEPFLRMSHSVAAKLSWLNYPQSLVVFVLCLSLWFPIVALSALWYRVFELPSITAGKRIMTNARNTHKASPCQ